MCNFFEKQKTSNTSFPTINKPFELVLSDKINIMLTNQKQELPMVAIFFTQSR
jgi:hypothetical protein